MNIYTKTGDLGETGLLGGVRVAKDDPRIEAYGMVDEFNAVLGVARACDLPAEIDHVLARLQNELFELGAELARPKPPPSDQIRIREEEIAALETEIDRFESTLAPLREFILPGGSPSAAALHLARTVCRQAERRVVELSRTADDAVRPEAIIYLNRLSDLLFVLARAANAAAKVADVPWQKPG